MNTFDAVQCEVCKKIYKSDSKKFIFLLGGILKGAHGGLFGGAPRPDGTLHNSFYCPGCLIKEIAKEFDVDLISLEREKIEEQINQYKVPNGNKI